MVIEGWDLARLVPEMMRNTVVKPKTAGAKWYQNLNKDFNQSVDMKITDTLGAISKWPEED